MGRKKKLINNTNIPEYAIERFARCVFDDIRAAYADEEIQKEFAEWQAEQAARKANLKLHTKKAGAASKAAPVALLMSFLAPWSPWLGFWSHLPAIGKVGVLIPREINK